MQNDILKEYIARGTQRFPVTPSLGLSVDAIEHALRELPSFYPISISGYHIREAGSTAVEEVDGRRFVFYGMADSAIGVAVLEAAPG